MPISPQKWTSFLRELKNKKCCLLLGPEIACLGTANGSQQTVQEAFSTYVERRLTEEQVPFDANVPNLYYRVKTFIGHQYAEYPYRFAEEVQQFNTSVLQVLPPYFDKLAKLPFHSIVNMVPDNFLGNTLLAAGYEYVGEHYDYSNPEKKKITLADEMQLVYNIFGNFDNPASIALTEKEQLHQIKSIVAGNPGIPFQITNRFKDEKKSFLFLGFDFNDWKFRLIMDALQIPKPQYSLYPIFSDSHQVAFMTQQFYTDKFGIEFLQPDTDQFIRDLLVNYEAAFGQLDRQLQCVIDYHTDNYAQFQELKKHLGSNGISRRMQFSHKLPGEHTSQLDEQAVTADVYIPLMSSSFIGDEDCRQRITRVSTQSSVKIIPVIAEFTAYESIIPGIKKRQLIVLPRDGKTLSSSTAKELPDVCYRIAKTINCIIR